MPGYSGLSDGVHGVPYAPIANKAPVLRGMMRMLFAKRAYWPLARALGIDAPTSVKGVDSDRNDMTVRGSFDYAKWKVNPDDPTRFIKDVTMRRIGGDVNTIETRQVLPTDMPMDDAIDMMNTRLQGNFVADASGLPVTSPALAPKRAT